MLCKILPFHATREAAMDRLVRQQYLERYRRELTTVRDQVQRLRLLKLLEEEESNEPILSVRKRHSLNVVKPPLFGRHTIDAPPILIASTHTTDYCCGSCGAVLMHADTGQVHDLLIHCTACGSYNSTDD